MPTTKDIVRQLFENHSAGKTFGRQRTITLDPWSSNTKRTGYRIRRILEPGPQSWVVVPEHDDRPFAFGVWSGQLPQKNQLRFEELIFSITFTPRPLEPHRYPEAFRNAGASIVVDNPCPQIHVPFGNDPRFTLAAEFALHTARALESATETGYLHLQGREPVEIDIPADH